MRYFVVSDVHGYLEPLKTALAEAGFNQDTDTLVSCGDLIDRGPQSIETIQYIMGLPHHFCIQGNHEDLMNDLIARRGMPFYNDYCNGTFLTFEEIQKKSAFDLWRAYQKECSNAVIIGKYFCTHGFVPYDSAWDMSPDGWLKRYYTVRDLDNCTASDWENARWGNCMEADEGIKDDMPYVVVAGHYHTSFGHVLAAHPHATPEWREKLEFAEDADFSIYYGKHVVAIDACTAWTKKVNVFVIDSDDAPKIMERAQN